MPKSPNSLRLLTDRIKTFVPLQRIKGLTKGYEYIRLLISYSVLFSYLKTHITFRSFMRSQKNEISVQNICRTNSSFTLTTGQCNLALHNHIFRGKVSSSIQKSKWISALTASVLSMFSQFGRDLQWDMSAVNLCPGFKLEHVGTSCHCSSESDIHAGQVSQNISIRKSVSQSPRTKTGDEVGSSYCFPSEKLRHN